jgi:4-amino-4-deoxychorismate lyase
MDRWLINGVLTDTVSPNDRGLAYGDGLFETLAVRQGEIRFLAEHMERLQVGCKRLSIDLDVHADLPADMRRCIASAETGTLKVIVTRGCGPRGYAPPEHPQPTLMVGFAASEAGARDSRSTEGVTVRYCTTRISRNESLAGLKTLNRLEQVMARLEWGHNPEAYAEGLMLNDRDEVVCGTMSNLFLITDNRLLTPPVTECGIAGVMRAQVMRIAAEQGIALVVQSLSKQDLETADSVFLTNTLIGMWPVNALEAQTFVQHPLLDVLRTALISNGVGECA